MTTSFSLWSLYRLSFVLFIVVIALSVHRPFYCGQGRRTDNTMTTIKRTKDRQYNDHNKKDEGQTIQWPQWKGRRTDNTMTTIKRTKNRQCHGPSSFLLWSLYCLSFVLFIVVIVLSVLRPFYCGHCIVCPSSFLLWSLHCLFFVLFIVVIAWSVLRRQCNDHNKKDEGQTIQWPQ
jgi:Flp pilus assembly protein TadB